MQDDFTSLLFDDYSSWITMFKTSELDVDVTLTFRGDSKQSTFEKTLYSTIKYELVHDFASAPSGPVTILVQVVDSQTKEPIQKRDLLASPVHHWVKGSKHVLKFQDCTYHNRKKPWCLKILYYIDNTLQIIKLSPPFMVYARKREIKRKRDENTNLDDFEKILTQLVDITSKLDPKDQPKALKMICNGLV